MSNPTAKSSTLQKHVLNFDIDNYLNPICPRQRFYLLPNFVSYWFGYRSPNAKPQPKLPNLGVWISALLGGFIGIAIVTNVYAALPMLGSHQAPLVIASFGAAAILEYNTIESPLSQPRNLIVGHFLSALVGVAITKGFEQLPADRFLELRWLAGSLSVGVASFVMGMTKTVHPPAGATALLASTSPEITILGWWLLPLVLLASVLMCASALVVNNLTRRWPLYWWTAADLSSSKPDIEHVKDVEKQVGSDSNSDLEVDSNTERSTSEGGSTLKCESRHVEGKANAPSESEDTASGDKQQVHRSETHIEREHEIVITAEAIVLPDWYEASDWEKQVLEEFRGKLARRMPASRLE